MRISRLSTAAAVVLLAIGTTAVESSSDSLSGTKADILEPPVGVPDRLSSQKGSSSKAYPKGTLDAPVDGKDGKPHDGPWVESDGKTTPNSNEGVMGDPSRLGPKEGTRGTEGGMTEKTKDTKQYKDKKPETPKEARPLPHSEQEKIPGYEDNSEATDTKTGDTLLEVRSPLNKECIF